MRPWVGKTKNFSLKWSWLYWFYFIIITPCSSTQSCYYTVKTPTDQLPNTGLIQASNQALPINMQKIMVNVMEQQTDSEAALMTAGRGLLCVPHIQNMTKPALVFLAHSACNLDNAFVKFADLYCFWTLQKGLTASTVQTRAGWYGKKLYLDFFSVFWTNHDFKSILFWVHELKKNHDAFYGCAKLALVWLYKWGKAP